MIARWRSLSARDGLLLVVCALIAFIGVAAQIRDVTGMPFLSEDWTQLAEMKGVPTLLGALDRHLEPLRPLQHAYFWLLAHVFEGRLTDPAVVGLAHGLALALHAVSCVLVYKLAREMGLGILGALAAAWLFAMFPNVKSLAWPAAIGSPGRVTCELLALVCWLRHAKTRSAASGALGLTAFVLALGFHESAMLVPVFVAAWLVFGLGASPRAGVADLLRRWRDRWFATLAALTAVYVVHLAFLRPERHHQLKSLAALPANFVKAALSLAPEFVRVPAVDGLRGEPGSWPFLAGALIVLAAVTFAGYVFTRNAFARFIVVAIAIELALPMIGAGFVQRYAYLASAYAAIGVARWYASAPRGVREAAVLALGLCWAFDTQVDRADVREAGLAARRLVATAREQRAVIGPGVPIAIVDASDMAGTEEDIPLFNWGADFMLAAHQVDGPWLFWRTRAFRTSTNFEFVDAARIEEARRTGSPRLLFVTPNPN